MAEQIAFITEEGEEILFYVIDETRVNGVNYLLVTDNDTEEETDCYIMKDTSLETDIEAVYEFVEDDEELRALFKLFTELLGDDDY